MLPSLGPRVSISANTGASIRSHGSSSRPPASSEASRSRRNRPPLAPGCCAATLAQPTRKSLDGIKPLDSAQGLRPEQFFEDVQTLPVAGTVSELSTAADIPHSVSAASLSSESDLALLLGATTADLTQAASGQHSTPLVFGSFPPVAVSLPSSAAAAAADPAEASAATEATADYADAADNAKAASTTKLKATSVEFYPEAYLAAAAATALAARTISSSISRSASPQQASAVTDPNAADEETSQPLPAAAEAPASYEAPQVIVEEHYPQQQQQNWAVQQWQQPMTEQQWHQHQHWQHWQQQQQQSQGHQMVPMPVLVPVYVQPYPYAHYVHPQQHPQMHMMPVMMPPADPAAASHQHQQQQQQMQQVCPPSPMSGYSLPADTCSLMGGPTPAGTPMAAATPTGGWHHSSTPYDSSRPGSSASSVVSGYSTSRRHQRQQFGDQVAREAGTVTVSAMSCVKDAAGALAKVVTRHGNCLLLSLVKPGDAAAQSTHVAAKSLAVARFYVNAHMAAAGAAGIDAAAALTGVDHAAGEPSAATDAAEAVSADAAAAVDDEVVFMPYHRSSSSSAGSSRPSMDSPDLPLGFMVAKASTKDLPVHLPPPVGIPACMQDKVGQQQQGQQQPRSSSANSSSSTSSTTLLKAGANTDVNKLSNAVIHNILGSGHVAMQLAGAAACHVAMRALVKARDRLQRKFETDIVATASFANEDTSSSIGRSTVFLRLDVMRSNLLHQVAAAGSAIVQAVEGHAQQPAMA